MLGGGPEVSWNCLIRSNSSSVNASTILSLMHPDIARVATTTEHRLLERICHHECKCYFATRLATRLTLPSISLDQYRLVSSSASSWAPSCCGTRTVGAPPPSGADMTAP